MIRFLCLATLLIASVAAGEETFLTANHAKQFAEIAKGQYEGKAQATSYADQEYFDTGMQESYLWGQRDGRAKVYRGAIFWLTEDEWTFLGDAVGARAYPTSSSTLAQHVNLANIHTNLGNGALNDGNWENAVLSFQAAKNAWEDARDGAELNLGYISARLYLFQNDLLILHTRWNQF